MVTAQIKQPVCGRKNYSHLCLSKSSYLGYRLTKPLRRENKLVHKQKWPEQKECLQTCTALISQSPHTAFAFHRCAFL